MTHSGYKANLLQNARFQMAASGGSLRLRDERVYFTAKDGRLCVVWFPVESRVRDLEIVDMKEAIAEMSGHSAFSLRASASASSPRVTPRNVAEG